MGVIYLWKISADYTGSSWWIFVCPGRVFGKNLVNNQVPPGLLQRGVKYKLIINFLLLSLTWKLDHLWTVTILMPVTWGFNP